MDSSVLEHRGLTGTPNTQTLGATHNRAGLQGQILKNTYRCMCKVNIYKYDDMCLCMQKHKSILFPFENILLTMDMWKWWSEGITKSDIGVLTFQILEWLRILGISSYIHLHATKEAECDSPAM